MAEYKKLKQVREYLGHNGFECRVKISLSGEVTRHGSPNPQDRSKDYWQDLGTVESVLNEMQKKPSQ